MACLRFLVSNADILLAVSSKKWHRINTKTGWFNARMTKKIFWDWFSESSVTKASNFLNKNILVTTTCVQYDKFYSCGIKPILIVSISHNEQEVSSKTQAFPFHTHRKLLIHKPTHTLDFIKNLAVFEKVVDHTIYHHHHTYMT